MNRLQTLPSLYGRNSPPPNVFKKKKTNIISRLGFHERVWFEKRGKSDSVMFTAQMLDNMRKYFNDLDTDCSGAIGQNQLEDPLITFEFCSSKQEVKNLINTLDLDGSGSVEFSQFLQIFRKFKLDKYANSEQAQKYNKFMKMFNSNKSESYFGKEKNYRLSLSELRRKKLIQQLIDPSSIPPPEKKQLSKQTKLNFIHKIQNQFIQTPQLNSVLQLYKSKDYSRLKLGEN